MPVTDYFSKKTIYTVHKVSNMEKAKEFYTNILELNVTFEAPFEFGWCEIALPVEGAYLGLSLNREETLTSVDVLNLSCTNLEGMLKVLKDKGVEVSEITDIPDMISSFSIKDPDGNTISFIGAPRKKSSREI
ncbi:MAG: VOC family protein [Candidatus Hodarchaeota archaeon]